MKASTRRAVSAEMTVSSRPDDALLTQWNTTHKRPNRPAYLPRWLASLLLNDSTSISRR